MVLFEDSDVQLARAVLHRLYVPGSNLLVLRPAVLKVSAAESIDPTGSFRAEDVLRECCEELANVACIWRSCRKGFGAAFKPKAWIR